ncbi:MAG TPA: hypothetical protein G4O12_07665 [Dehalococcoidia bacterium]|nr:hypothetical protein [Dehalococcoidia bacterium]
MKKVLWITSLALMISVVLAVPTLVSAAASFEIANLSINPTCVKEGNSITISAVVTNTGNITGSHTVELKINDAVEATENVTLPAGGSDTINFQVTKDTAGDYSVELDGLTGTFTVAPSALTISNLIIDPREVNEGGTIIISATVANSANTTLSYPLKLMIDDVVEATKDINLPPGGSDTVSFTVTGDIAGDYIVELGTLTGAFKVKTSFWAMFPPYIWAAFGAIAGVLVMLIIVLAITPRKKKEAGATPKAGRFGRQAPPPITQMPKPTQPPIPTGFPSAGPVPPVAPPVAPPPTPPTTGTRAVPTALFSASNLTITPNQVKEGEPITVSAIVTNNGTEIGKYSLVLRIGGVVENITELTLSPRASQTGTFTVVKDTGGEYYVEVDSLSGTFTVIPLMPAAFSVSNLAITPERVRQGESVAISAVVTNTGEVTGNYSVVLKVKGIAEGIEEISLAPGRSQRVAFNITKDAPGFYPIALENLTGKFVVEMDWKE